MLFISPVSVGMINLVFYPQQFPPTEAYFDRMILPRCEKDDALTFEKARNNLVRFLKVWGFFHYKLVHICLWYRKILSLTKMVDYAVIKFRLHVFYGDLTETTVEQEKAYELQNFIGEKGLSK